MSEAQEKDPQRAIRLRDNKRRHRLRKKEYVADLERRLAEAHNHGIQATKEVQAAAQRVVWENLRLRQILHERGLNNDEINSLIYKDAPFKCVVASEREAANRPATVHYEAREEPNADPESIEYGLKCSLTCSSTASPRDALAISNTHAVPPEKAHSEKMSPDVTTAPCKLLTILAGNPNADITQLPAAVDEKSECEETDSVECSRAREMLMRFAITEEKLDVVACALEEGCVKNGSGGGCHVKNDVIWKTLDRICD